MTLHGNVITSKTMSISALAFYLLFACSGASGTSYQFKISVCNLNSGIPIFKFTKPLLAPPKGQRKTVELNSFLVVSRNSQGWDYKNPVWAFEREPGSYVIVERITYGMTPSGFKETTAARPLSVGMPYLAIAFGAGGGGEKEFQSR
jgi:hypothetical protein